jgi:hypothetical protein
MKKLKKKVASSETPLRIFSPLIEKTELPNASKPKIPLKLVDIQSVNIVHKLV